MVGQEEAIDDGFVDPLDERSAGAEAGEDGREVLLVDGLHEGGAARGGLGG